MDNQKQIEEMARIMCGCFNRKGLCALRHGAPCDKFNNQDCYYKNIAETIYNTGYSKTPEDLVLTNEEYKAHKKLAEAVYEGGAFDHYDNVINSANILFKERKNLIEDTRKETAKEILQRIMNIIKKSDGFLAQEVVRIMEKQFGVEVEE